MYENSISDVVFNIDETLHETVVRGKIEKKQILGLGRTGMNPSTFLLCLALGVYKGERTPTIKVYGWVRRSAFGEGIELVEATILNELIKENKENMITNLPEVKKIAEEYANTGLKVIDEMIPDIDNYDDEIFAYEIMSILDAEYGRVINS